MVDLLFAYGTLRTGFHQLQELLGKDGYSLLGGGTIRGKRLEGTPYPAVVKDATGERISGELIQLCHVQDALDKLDDYEAYYPAHPEQSLYIREMTTVTSDDGSAKDAWVYYYNKA